MDSMRQAKDTFTLWNALKKFATSYAASGKPLPTRGDCELWVGGWLKENGLTNFPPLAKAFYVTELFELIHTARRTQ